MPPLDVLAGRETGYGLQRVYCNAKTPYKGVAAATHGLQTQAARVRAGRSALKNTYEPRTLIPNSMVATHGTTLQWIEKAGWFSDLNTFHRHYEKVLLQCQLDASISISCFAPVINCSHDGQLACTMIITWHTQLSLMHVRGMSMSDGLMF